MFIFVFVVEIVHLKEISCIFCKFRHAFKIETFVQQGKVKMRLIQVYKYA
jgi:hypothetical protein